MDGSGGAQESSELLWSALDSSEGLCRTHFTPKCLKCLKCVMFWKARSGWLWRALNSSEGLCQTHFGHFRHFRDFKHLSAPFFEGSSIVNLKKVRFFLIKVRFFSIFEEKVVQDE